MQCSDVVLSTNVLSVSLLVELWGAEDRLQGDISQPEASYSSPEIPPGMFQGCGHVRLPFPPAVCFRFLCCVCVCSGGSTSISVALWGLCDRIVSTAVLSGSIRACLVLGSPRLSATWCGLCKMGRKKKNRKTKKAPLNFLVFAQGGKEMHLELPWCMEN